MRDRSLKSAGFTLIELALVLIIISVLVAMVVPNLDNLSPKYKLRAGAREIAATIEKCRSQSALKRKTYSLVYDLDEDSYWILLPQELDEYGEPLETERKPILPKRRLPSRVEMVEVVTADNESTTTGQVQLDFSPFGNTGSHIVSLRYGDEDDDKLKIWVRANAFLGFTTFHHQEIQFAEYEAEEDDETYDETP